MDPKSVRAMVYYFILLTLSAPASAEIIYQDLPLVPKLAKTHGVVMGVAFTIMFPLGALLVRALKTKETVWVHVAFQLVGWVLMIAGLATGIKVGKILDRLHNNAHTILGTIVVVLMLAQPFVGFIHHRMFMKTQKRGAWTHIHIWYGRVLILLGIINGGLGLQLASNSKGGTIAYGVVGGVMGAGYYIMAVVAEMKRRNQKEDIGSEERLEERSKSQTA
ncbi:hypothetical protein FQN55_008772 [Onygenales sp. PD_40]|nr:hypothetical protein FQN55_008772 [Onygenales sp. PD_40]KAK2767368.1 hypothetical protein FQN53_006454 [Emmonsiellopsis sp. PD_33]